MSLADILAVCKHLSITPNNRIKCSYTDHEMPARADIVQQYLNSKAFKKAKEWYSFDYTQFLPYIVEDSKNPKQLYCKLTKKSLNKIPDEVDRHSKGKKFQRLKMESEQKSKKKQKASESDEELDFWVPEVGDDSAEPSTNAKRPKKTSRIFIDDDVSIHSDDFVSKDDGNESDGDDFELEEDNDEDDFEDEQDSDNEDDDELDSDGEDMGSSTKIAHNHRSSDRKADAQIKLNSTTKESAVHAKLANSTEGVTESRAHAETEVSVKKGSRSSSKKSSTLRIPSEAQQIKTTKRQPQHTAQSQRKKLRAVK